MILLMILDGYGIDVPGPGNAISLAKKPNLDKLFSAYPHTQIGASGLSVGLPDGQMGNSEVGHLNMGAGRIIYQEITRIDKAIDDGDFFANPVLKASMSKAAKSGNAVHLFGLVSDGGVHSSLKHLDALIDMAKKEGVRKLFLHAFMDGRDTSPTSGVGFMQERVAKFAQVGLGAVATVMGRYWGMDRDKRWDRVEKAYNAIVKRVGVHAIDPVQAVQDSYARNVTDEFIEPIVINTQPPFSMSDGDLFLFFNFRSDRVREIASIFYKKTESTFPHPEGPNVELVSLTQYDETFGFPIAFPYRKHERILVELLTEKGKKYLKIAETEKYPHVTYFLNGGREEQYPGEDRIMVPSPKVATYDLQPEMSAPELTDRAVEAIYSG